jgi:hypothetical protein
MAVFSHPHPHLPCEHNATRRKATIALIAMIGMDLNDKIGGWEGTCLDY